MAVLGQPIPQSSDNVAFEGGYDPNANQMAAKELDSSQTANSTTYGPQRVVISALAGSIAAAGSQPSATTAATDTAWSFAQKVNHVLIQNNSTASVQFDFETTANAGSPVIAVGSVFFFDIKVTTIHLLTATAQNINGNSGGNIVIRGWL